MRLAWYDLSFPQVCARIDIVKIKCTTRIFERESLDHIMHGGSPKITKNWQEYQLKGVIDHAYLRGLFVVTLHVLIWKWLVSNDNYGNWIPIESLWGHKYLVHQGEQRHELIAYELRYENLVQ